MALREKSIGRDDNYKLIWFGYRFLPLQSKRF
jgi:hypothetical protein